MLNEEQIESFYERIKNYRNELIEAKKREENLKKEKEIIEEIEKLDIEITLLKVILES